MILHLVSDHVVTNTCLRVFREELPEQNIVLVFKLFNHQVDGGIVITDENSSEVAQNIDFSQVTHVIVSFLSRRKIHFIRKYVPENIPIIWWIYGADLYEKFLSIRGFVISYSDKDKYRYLGMLSFPFVKIARIIANIYFRYIQDKYIIKRLTGFVPCIKPEYDLLRQYVKGRKIDLIQIHPYGASFKFDGRYAEGKDIAIGHSASISVNHLYALKYLKKLNLGNSDIFITLSYSKTVPGYVKDVKRKYEKEYGDKVHFIETMMPKDEYWQSQFRYKAMILPSWRQEALDNIYTCLQIGIKLILSERSIVFQYLKEYGFIVFALEKIDQECLDKPLSLEEKKHNQQLFVRFVEERKSNYYSDFEKYLKKCILENGQQ